MKAVILVLVAVAGVSSARHPQRLFRTSAEAVRFEVTVVDDDGHVAGLGAKDFEVRDRGARQVVRVDEARDAPLDVSAVVPPRAAIGMIAVDQVARYSAALDGLFAQIAERDRLAVVLAGSPPRPLRQLTPGRSGVSADWHESPADRYPTIFDALVMGLGQFDASERRRVLAVFTTGADFRSMARSNDIVELTRRLDNAMLVLGLPVTVNATASARAELSDGRALGDAEERLVRGSVLSLGLQQFGRDTRSRVANLAADVPANVVAREIDRLRHYYIVTWPMPAGTGWHPVEVKVRRRGVKVTVRSGYEVD